MKKWNEHTPATILDHETGGELAAGLENELISDQAWSIACSIAAERGESVILDDADGVWVVFPDGTRIEAGQEWEWDE